MAVPFVRAFFCVPRQPVKVNHFSPSGIGLVLGVANNSSRWRYAAARIGITLFLSQDLPASQASTKDAHVSNAARRSFM